MPEGTPCPDESVCDGSESCDAAGVCVDQTELDDGQDFGSLGRTPWAMHQGEGLVSFGFTSPSYGHESEYAFATIPPSSDPGWGSAPNVNTIGYSVGSTLCGQLGCRTGAQFTYFQTFVGVPSNTVVTTFTIQFSGIDDGVRTTIFNSENPSGVVIPGSYVYRGGSGTANVAACGVPGEVNRVGVTRAGEG
jgi:hypothetical protein